MISMSQEIFQEKKDIHVGSTLEHHLLQKVASLRVHCEHVTGML